MPTTLTPSIAAANMKMRWKEPYVTEGLNKKLAGITPAGIYRGLSLGINGAALSISIIPDSVVGDHLAVYETSDGYSLTYRDISSGTMTVNLSALINQTVVITILADYTIGVTSTIAFTAYTLAEFNALGAAARGELIVLGTVVVPAAGVISASSITADRRTAAWENLGTGAMPWSPLLRNGDFEFGDTASTGRKAVGFWEKAASDVDGSFGLTASAPRSGLNALGLTVANAAAPISTAFIQYIGCPVVAGQLMKVKFYVRADAVPTSGTFNFIVLFHPTATVTITVPMTGVDGSYREINAVIATPAGSDYLREVAFTTVGLTFTAPGLAFRVDDVQVWLERKFSQNIEGGNDKYTAGVSASSLTFEDIDETNDIFAGNAPVLWYNNAASANTVVMERRDGSVTNPPTLQFHGTLKELGKDRIANETDATIARISAPVSIDGSTEYTLMWESKRNENVLTQGGVRFYAAAAGKFVLTVNAVWGTTTWSKDVTGLGATKMELNQLVLLQSSRLAASNTPWADNAWSNIPLAVFGSNPIPLVLAGSLSTGLGYVSGSGAIAEANPQISTSYNTTVGTRALVFQTAEDGGPANRRVRMYVLFDGLSPTFEITINAKHTAANVGAEWSTALGGDEAFRMQISIAGVVFAQKVSGGGGTWADAAWNDAGTNASNPLHTSNIGRNAFPVKSVPKAFGTFTTTGVLAGNNFNATGDDGVNYVVTRFSNQQVLIQFVTPMANANYTVNASALRTDALKVLGVEISARTATDFKLRAWNMDTNAASILDTNALAVLWDFTVFGQQGS